MSNTPRDEIVGVDHIDRGRLIVEYSDDTSAVYTVEDLAALPNERIKPDLPIPDEV